MTVPETSTSPASSRSRDARADVDGDSGDLAVGELDLARVEPRSHGEVEWAHALDDRLRAADRSGRAVEGGEEAVARGVDLTTVEASELAADRGVMLFDEVPPASVADLHRALRRTDEIGEEHRRERTIRACSPRVSR